jgi:amino acid transporter
MFAVINGALIQIIMVSRILYGISRQIWLPNFLSGVHLKTSTPINATIFTGLL